VQLRSLRILSHLPRILRRSWSCYSRFPKRKEPVSQNPLQVKLVSPPNTPQSCLPVCSFFLLETILVTIACLWAIVWTAPKSGTKFSLSDLRSKIVSKDKGEKTPDSKPFHVPATRLGKRKKSSETAINLESFSELNGEETKDKLLVVSFTLLVPALRFL
jgi:hypothetical protein